jgi:hypothetical protein
MHCNAGFCFSITLANTRYAGAAEQPLQGMMLCFTSIGLEDRVSGKASKMPQEY